MKIRRLTRVPRVGIAVLSCMAVGMSMVASPAIAAVKPGYETVGTQNLTDNPTGGFKAGDPGLTTPLKYGYGRFYEGALERAFDGAQITDYRQFAGGTPIWPTKSVEKAADGTVTVKFAGSVNSMVYCNAVDGTRNVETRGNCQDDLTVSDPVATYNMDEQTATFSATIYYYDKLTHEYVGPKFTELASFPWSPDAEKPSSPRRGIQEVTKDGVTSVLFPMMRDSVEASDKMMPAMEGLGFGPVMFSYKALDGVEDQPEATSLRAMGGVHSPVLLQEYPESYSNTLFYEAGEKVDVGTTHTRSPKFTDAKGKTIPTPDGVKFSMREYSDPEFTVDEKTGVVTFTASKDSQKPQEEFAADGVVVATYPDGSVNETYIGFTLPKTGEIADTFGPGQGSPAGPNHRAYDPEQPLTVGYDEDEKKIHIIASEGEAPFSSYLNWSGKGLVWGNHEAMGILEAGPWGYGLGFEIEGQDPGRIGDSAMVALVPQASKTYFVNGNSLYLLSTTSYRPRAVAEMDNPVTGFAINQDYSTMGMITRAEDGTGTFTLFDTKREQTWEKMVAKDFQNMTKKAAINQFGLPSDLFGADSGAEVWGPADMEGVHPDLLPLPDGKWLWISDRALKDGKHAATPILIDPENKTATVAEGFDEQFKGVRSAADQLHGVVSGNNLVVFNQSTQEAGSKDADPQSIGVYTYDAASGSFTAVGPVGAVNGVSGVVAANFDEQGRPVFVDNANYLTVLDPKTREVVQGGKPFHGMENLASLNRQILVRKGDWYHTIGEMEGKQAVLEAAQPKVGAVEKAPEKTEAELYTPGVAKADKPASAGVKATSSPVVFTADGKEVDSPQGVTFAAAEGTDSRFSVDEATGAVTFTPTLADGVAGSVTVPVAVAYADGSTENVDVTIDVAKPAADVLYVVTYRDEFTPRGVVAGDTIAVNPVVTDFSGTRDDVADLGATFALGKGASSDLSIDPTTGVVTVTVTKANLAAGSVKVPVVVTHADGTTTTAETTVKLVKRIQPKPADKKPAPSAPSRDASSGSGEGGSVYGDAGVVGIVSLVAIIAAIAAAVTSTPGLVLPTLPGLPPAPRP